MASKTSRTRDLARRRKPAKARASSSKGSEDSSLTWWLNPVVEDPWGRWPAGQEPIRELEIIHVHGSDSNNLLLRSATVTVEPGVLPDARFNPDRKYRDIWDLQFRGRWNATWRGNRLAELSLDCFSEEWAEVIRFVFDPDEPVELLAAYNVSSMPMNGLTIKAEDMLTVNGNGNIMGHEVSARDLRLAIQIAARCPGVCEHTAWLEREIYHPTQLTSQKALNLAAEMSEAAEAVAGESAPGARLAMDLSALQGIAAMHGGESKAPPFSDIEPASATLDTYTMIGAPGLRDLAKADLVRVPPEIVSAMAANVTFPDAITAIRAATSARLPLWLDFTDDDDKPQWRKHPSGSDQPLYGVLITDFEDEEDTGVPNVRVVIPVGRKAGLVERPLPLCALAVGPDDGWRYPLLDNQIGLLSTHRGGVTVRHVRGYDWDLVGAEPEISSAEIRVEIAGYVARCTEWILARVGAVLGALEDGVLLLKRAPGSRTYRLIRAPAPKTHARTNKGPDGRVLVSRLRELGSVKRIAEAEGTDVTAVRLALEKLGVDPDQVRRDETIQRFRRSGSIEAVVSELYIHRGDVERFLLEAGVDWLDTPVPHDVTDKDVLAAITAYREQGTLEGAGDRLGVSGETIRRRLAQAGLGTSDVATEKERKAAHDAVEAWRAASHSLAGAARQLGIDPRTVKERLRQAGVSAAVARTSTERVAEARQLHQLVGSPDAVAVLMGISVSSVRRYLEDRKTSSARRVGRPSLSDGELDQVELAYAEHGSIRAAARSLGMSPGGFSHRLKLARARDGQAIQQSGNSAAVLKVKARPGGGHHVR